MDHACQSEQLALSMSNSAKGRFLPCMPIALFITVFGVVVVKVGEANLAAKIGNGF